MPPRVEPTPQELTDIARRMHPGQGTLTIDDARTLYLFGPAFIAFEADGVKGIVKARTSLEAALNDIRPRVGRDTDGHAGNYLDSRLWLGAAGYLMVLDQLATVLEGGIEELLTSPLAGLDEAEAGAICGLRNAFLHNYGLVNDAERVKNQHRRGLLRHVFRLQVGGNRLVELQDRTDASSKPLHQLPHTLVDLGLLGDLVERVVEELRHRHLSGAALNWVHTDVNEFSVRYFFSHLD